MEEFLRYLEGHKDLYQEAPAKPQPPLPTADGSRKRNPPERCLRPLYSQDSAQEEQSTPQGDGLMVVKVEDGEEADVRGEERGVEEEISPQISTDPGGAMLSRVKTEDDGETVIKEEDSVMQNSTELQDLMMGDYNVEGDGLVDIKEEQTFIEISTELKDTVMVNPQVLTITEVKIKGEKTLIQIQTEPKDGMMAIVKAEEMTEVQIKQEETCMQIKAEPRDPLMTNYNVKGDGLVNVQEEQTFLQISTESQDHMMRNGKAQEDGQVQTFIQISIDPRDPMMVDYAIWEDSTASTQEEQEEVSLSVSTDEDYRRYKSEKPPHLCSECKMKDDDLAFDASEENLHPELTSEGISPGQSHALPRFAETLQCSQCGECFAERAELVSHQSCHAAEQAYLCPGCGETFKERAMLLVHKISHKTSKPYRCFECKQCFSDRCSLFRHKKTHPKEVHTCPECGLTFTKEKYLLQHLSSHGGKKRRKVFSCPECRKVYPMASAYAKNLRIHLEAEPYLCSKCGKRYPNRYNPYKHFSYHKKKEFQCSGCRRSLILY